MAESRTNADFTSNAGNTNRFKFSRALFNINQVVGSVTAISNKSQLFVPMVFGLDLPGDPQPPDPLILYITPSDISIQRRKVLTEHYLRSGPIREEWGNELDVWNCSGWMAAFYKGVIHDVTSRSSPGQTESVAVNPVITQIDRGDTAGYRNFVSLLSFYKNNGRTYYDRGVSNDPQRNQLGSIETQGNHAGEQIIDTRNIVFPTEVTYVNTEENGQQKRIPIRARMPTGESSTEYRNRVRKSIRDASVASKLGISHTKNLIARPSRQIRHVGSVIIAYDMRVMLGHFDTFEWTESVDNPFQIKYAFTFVVKAQYDMAADWSGQGTVKS